MSQQDFLAEAVKQGIQKDRKERQKQASMSCLLGILIFGGLIYFAISSGSGPGPQPSTAAINNTEQIKVDQIISKYGTPDKELGVPGAPEKTDPDTGYVYTKRLLYYLKDSQDPNNPDKRVVFINGTLPTGVAVFYNDGRVVKEGL